MGIESFFGRYIAKTYQSSIKHSLPKDVTSLFIDCNGIFHNSAQYVYGYGKYTTPGVENPSELELINHIKSSLRGIVMQCKPSHNFILAPDGVAVTAKMNQQKSRRFLNAPTSQSSFDSNQFTPGTRLMVTLDNHLNEWIDQSKSILPPNIIYSSHLDHGEGEHKIFEFIRQKKIKNSGKGAHLLYGLDSDLIILSLLSNLKGIYLVREDYKSLIDVDKLRELVIEQFRFEGCNDKKLVKDFGVICMFAGNDFLPKLPGFTEIKEFLDFVTDIYKANGKHIVNRNNNIDFQVMMAIFDKLDEVEDEMIVEAAETHRFPYPEVARCLDSFGRSFNSQKFTDLWYCKQFCPSTGELAKFYRNNSYYNEQDIGQMVISFLKTMQWVHKYYTEGFTKVSNTHFYPYFHTPLAKSVYSILRTIYSSNQKQHLRRRIDKFYDVGGEDNVELTAIHQLLSVIPPVSRAIIPAEFDAAYDFMSPINPLKFKYKREGTSAEWHKVPLIPPVNVDMAVLAMKRVDAEVPDYLQSKTYSQINNTTKRSTPRRRSTPLKTKGKFKKTTDYTIQDIQLM